MNSCSMEFGGANDQLLLMACSATKLQRPAPAISLYQGVMWATYRKHCKNAASPHVVILSALHGFVSPGTVLEPYEQRMTSAKADKMVENLSQFMSGVAWPRGICHVFLSGGLEYRRVMRAAVASLVATQVLPASASVDAVSGGIGYQRSQLGQYLQAITGKIERS